VEKSVKLKKGNMLLTKGDYVIIETENVSFESKHGVVAPKGLEKGGTGIKGIVLADNDQYKIGDNVEFIRNMGYQIRENIYAVRKEQILFIGNLDEHLKQ